MEMAEKDATEGRCPACRTRYDKERIVGTAANCERLHFFSKLLASLHCLPLFPLPLSQNKGWGWCLVELLCWFLFYWIDARLVAEVNMERKQKSQKAKIKTSESRKQLSSVRVIQRNLVYIVGLPLHVADEDVRTSMISSFFVFSLGANYLYWISVQLLQRKEYFGQYGNVLKVSVSRTSTGSIQQFANNTFSV